MKYTLAILCLLIVAVMGITIPKHTDLKGMYTFPQFDQCDPRWGNNEMGVKGNGERATICKEGCAMTSTAMALNGLGVKINDAPVNPANLNTWLEGNSGYLCLGGDCNNLNLTSPEHLTTRMSLIGEVQKPAFGEIAHSIKLGRIINIAHVRNKTHFVLLTAPLRREKAFVVHDPFFNQTVYNYDEITDIIRFKVNVYPLYKQCNSSWGSLHMGVNNDTICQVGCLMSSISSGLAGTNIQVEGKLATPESVNSFLRSHNGFVDNCSALSEAIIAHINPARVQWPSNGMHLSNDIPFDTIKTMIDGAVPKITIANVMHGDHFVLVVGYRDDGDTLIVNDSGFNRNSYSYSKDVVGWRVFDMEE